jgi:hypothetical protein
MNTHVRPPKATNIAPSVAALPKTGMCGTKINTRRRVYFAEWKFRIGEEASSGEMSVIILSRHRTAQGRELYQVWVTGESYGRPNRWILGSALISHPTFVSALEIAL